MFKNIGKKIQIVSSTIFAILVLVGIFNGLVSGVIMGTLVDSFSRDEGAGIIAGFSVGLITIGVSVFLAWLSQLVIYAYGKIAECSEEQCRLLRELIALQAGGQAVVPAPAVRTCACGAKLEPDAVFCPECGKPCGTAQTNAASNG